MPVLYVGIGASAGGLEALETFFTHMPPDTGMAFVVIQHLSPDYKSMMVELLSKRTSMKVNRAEEGMLVEPNTVYLIPPKKNLSIFHGKLLLSEQDTSKGINLPIDFFFKSLADDQAEKAVGIILSGTGSDGVRGIRALKETGGMVLVQSEETARFDGMPRSAISTGLADFILPPDEMPQKLISLARYPNLVKPEHPQTLLSDEDGMARIFALLREYTRVDFTYYKPSTVVRRIERRMTFNQITDLRDYVRYMESHTGEVMALYRELLIGVTSFFRDREVFEELETKYLPEILSRGGKREIRLWSAGCSTGEEAYTLAILSREVMEQIGIRLDIKIFATDIDRDAILQAGAGLYPESIAADLPPRLLAKYFYHKGDRYQVDRSIREMVVFAQHNIIKDPPFTNIDLLSCRNLLIYLQPVLQNKVMELLNFSLNPQGILILGTSETTGENPDWFEPLNQKYRIYQSKGKRRTPTDASQSLPTTTPRTLYARSNRLIGGLTTLRSNDEERMFDRFLQSLAGVYVPLALVVNEQMEVLHILGDPEGYFRLPSGKLLNDITRMAIKELSIPLSTGLQKVFKTGEDLKYSNIRVNFRDEVKTVQVLLKLLPAKKGQEPLAAVFIEEVSKQPLDDKDTTRVQVYDVSREAEQRIRDLEQELQFTRENLQATIEELETSNEELQATNEELLASNEELQSTNEELQSVNEELHTVNAEYQSKIIELTELTNDLDNLMASTQVGTLFLDENLEIRRFTPEIRRIFKILDNDIGRPFHHLSHSLIQTDLLQLVTEVEITNLEKEMEVSTTQGEWFLMRILPYSIGAQKFSGVLLTFFDITRLKKVQQELLDAESKITSLYRAAPIGIGRWSNDVIKEVEDKACSMLGYPCEELLEMPLQSLFADHKEYQNVDQEVQKQIAAYGQSTIETTLKRKDQSVFPVLLSVTPFDPASPDLGMTFTLLDLSLRHKAIEEARASEERYKLLFNTMTEGVVYQDSDGKITAANPAAERILGLSIDEMTGRTSMDPRWRSVDEDGSPLPGEQHPSMVAIRTGKVLIGQIMGVFNPKLEQMRWLRVNAIPIYEDGKPTQVYATFNDITDFWKPKTTPSDV